MRGSILVKFIKTIELLSKSSGTTIDEIAEELGVERCSAYRELNVVEALSFPLCEEEPLDGERKKRWKLEKDYVKTLSDNKVPNISFTLSEIIAMYLLRGEGKLFKGTTIEKLNSAFG